MLSSLSEMVAAYIVIVKIEKIEQDMFYMKNEPHSASTIKDYLKANGCTVELIPLSGIYDKAKHKITQVYNTVKVHAPRAVRPDRLLSLVEVLEKLLSRYYISTTDLSPEHRRRVTRVQGVLTRPDKADEDQVSSSDLSQSAPSAPDLGMEDLSRLAATRAGLDAAAVNAPILATLSEMMAKLTVNGRVMCEIKAAIASLTVKVDRLTENDKNHDIVLQQLVNRQASGKWCSFCKTATHMLSECKSKLLCDVCFLDSHKQGACPLRGLDCSVCGMPTHSGLVHQVIDPVLRELALAKFGPGFVFNA